MSPTNSQLSLSRNAEDIRIPSAIVSKVGVKNDFWFFLLHSYLPTSLSWTYMAFIIETIKNQKPTIQKTEKQKLKVFPKCCWAWTTGPYRGRDRECEETDGLQSKWTARMVWRIWKKPVLSVGLLRSVRWKSHEELVYRDFTGKQEALAAHGPVLGLDTSEWTRPVKAERPEASRATADGRGRGRGIGSESERPQMKQQFVWHRNSFMTPLLILMGQKKREVKVEWKVGRIHLFAQTDPSGVGVSDPHFSHSTKERPIF